MGEKLIGDSDMQRNNFHEIIYGRNLKTNVQEGSEGDVIIRNKNTQTSIM